MMKSRPSRVSRIVEARRRKRAHGGKLECVVHYGVNGDDVFEIGHAGYPIPLVIDRQGLLELKGLVAEAEEKSEEADRRGAAARMFERSERLRS
ncbi:hypothetical protein [Paradevosia shaoguanensis]|uniref:Uncharacterized protein n=1 Tax=Paradevosia shaoguanensis TaxID=1335043 RepID=A0AA41QQF2_9HYPH|nr:hypothetical protein [Paradevosia shaoguanensis]MCF1744195.1 hypothetical protein [Paradevosia shaoguanensis]MCI0128678.1 hypothetical protein [Paradevosia shaoguanensis]